MSMADPFLPVQPATHTDGPDPLEPEDFDEDDGGDTDVPRDREEGGAPSPADADPPTMPAVFRTPDGDRVDPTEDS